MRNGDGYHPLDKELGPVNLVKLDISDFAKCHPYTNWSLKDAWRFYRYLRTYDDIGKEEFEEKVLEVVHHTTMPDAGYVKAVYKQLFSMFNFEDEVIDVLNKFGSDAKDEVLNTLIYISRL